MYVLRTDTGRATPPSHPAIPGRPRGVCWSFWFALPTQPPKHTENQQAPKSGPMGSKPPPSATPASRQSARTVPLQETGSGHILDGAMEKSHSLQKCHAQGGTHESTWHACFSVPVELRQPQAE